MIRKKILVTGGSGFIGTNFIKLLIEETDHLVINVDSLTYASNNYNESYETGDGRYMFFKQNIVNKSLLSKVFEECKPDMVVNFAAESHVDRSIDSPTIFIQSNILGTQNLIELALDFNVERFLQISTDEVYGDLTLDEPPFTEKTKLSPSSPYSASKASADLLVQAANRTFGLNTIITRCSNNFGPFQFPEKLIPVVINCIHESRIIPVYGNGKNIRDWIFVKDHCQGILKALEFGKPGEIYNFGGNNELSNIELVKILIEFFESSESLISFVDDRKGHDFRYSVDFSKATKELGWVPVTDFSDAIYETCNWYSKEKENFEEIFKNIN